MERYVSGTASAPGFDNPLRLASNESSWGASPSARRAFLKTASQLNRYPDREGTALRETLAAVTGLEANRIVLGNGSDELIGLIARVCAGPGDEIIHSRYGFLMYRIAANAAGATAVPANEPTVSTDVDAILSKLSERTKLVFLANPNNPTGTLLPSSEITRLHRCLPTHVVLVLDAAYAEYVDSPDYDPGYAIARTAPNVVVLRTFSKIHGLAALRIGWLYGPRDLADKVDALRPPFNANAAAQAAAAASVQDGDWIAKVARETNSARRFFESRLEKLALPFEPGAGNFILVHFGSDWGSAAAVNAALLAAGIIIRPLGPYKLADHLRLTIGRRSEMDRVARVLARIKAEAGSANAAA